MKIKLYFDADAMDKDLVQALQLRGLDVDTAHEAGMSDATDDAQLAYATAHGRALYSFNIGDYMNLHAVYLNEGKNHAGIILAQQQRYSVGEQMRRLLHIVSTKTAERMQNKVEFLSTWG